MKTHHWQIIVYSASDRENPWILARFPEIEMHVVVQWPPSDGDYNNLLQSMKIPL